MMTKLIGALAAAAAVLVVGGVALADHSWATYHWPTANRTLEVLDSTSATFDIDAARAEWNATAGGAVTLADAAGGAFDVEVKEKKLARIYLGVAKIKLDGDGHIRAGLVQLNTFHWGGLSFAQWDEVACQELGHILGLDHNRDGTTGGEPDDTCMNDRATLGDNTAPNSHDAAQLALIYGHTDTVVDEPVDDGGGPDCNKSPNAKKCRDGGGWITIHAVLAPGG